MRAKQAEARRKLASLSGRRQMVEAGRALRGSTCSSTHEPTASLAWNSRPQDVGAIW